MKNLFFVSVAFSILSGTSLTANAQQSFNFTDGIDLSNEGGISGFTKTAHGPFSINAAMAATRERKTAGTETCTPLQFKYAQLLNREVESVSNINLFSFIDLWYGTRYRYGGTTKRGIDCSSLTEKLMKAVYCIELPRTARAQYAACTKISNEQMTEGDLVFFNTRGGISHVGFFLGEGYFVHASSSNGVIISHIDDPYYKRRFIGAGRINTTPPPVSMEFTTVFL